MLMNTEQYPVLNPSEFKDYEIILQAAKIQAQPEQKKIQEKYIELEAPKLVEAAQKIGSDLSLEDAEKTVQARCGNGALWDLYRDDVLNFDKYGTVSIGEVLENLEKYDQATGADPQEPELGKCKGKFYANGNDQKPCFNSFAHGGIKYLLHAESVNDESSEEGSLQNGNLDIKDAICNVQQLASEIEDGSIDILAVNPVVEEILNNQKFAPLELHAFKEACKKYLKIPKNTLDAILRQNKTYPNGSAMGKVGLWEDATHIEIADHFIENIEQQYQEVVGAEDSLWRYGDSTNGLYEKYSFEKVEIESAREYTGLKNYKKGPDYKAATRLMYYSKVDEKFFYNAPYGLPGASKFYQITENGLITLSYTPELKARWKLDTDPATAYCPEKAPMFQNYLDYALDKAQQLLLQEVVGALLTGCMCSLQKAALLLGLGDNGKSVLLDLITHAFHQDFRCAIKPDQMNDVCFKALLAGKIINIIGEVGNTKPINSDFKDIVSADTYLTAKPLYINPFQFLPKAGHIFSANAFPMTNDHSDGFYRRWAIIYFEKKVPPKMKIRRLGKKIAENEMDQFLAWGLEGVERLIGNNFELSKTKQHTEQMNKWKNVQDSVFNFLNDDEAVEYIEGVSTYKQSLYTAYSKWAKEDAGVRPVGRNTFYERAALKLKVNRVNGRRAFAGIILKKWHADREMVQHADNSEDSYSGIERGSY